MLSERQIALLKAIINEYIESSSPVGSVELVSKYRITYSAATVRNEMARLLEQGFLDMIHTSSGRVPTPMAYRFFLNEIMKEEELPVLHEVAIKQKLWPHRYNFEKLLRQAAVTLSDVNKEMAFAITEDGFIVNSGVVNILDHREFWNIEVAKSALHLFDRPELLMQVLQKAKTDDVKCLIGDDLGNQDLVDCSVIYAPFKTSRGNGYLGVLGPARQKYQTIMPAVRYTRNLVKELGESW